MIAEPGRVLLGVNEPQACKELVSTLSAEDCEVRIARDSIEAVSVAQEWKPQIIVLRLTEPKRGSLDVCRRLRRFSEAPILVLDPLADETDRIAGLEVGADAYLAEPISSAELRARVRVHLRPPRRAESSSAIATFDLIRVGSLAVSPSQRRAWRNGRALSLAHREFDVLAYLARHRDVVLSRRQIAEAVWGTDVAPDSRRVDTIISRLRSKLGEHGVGFPQLHTMPGVGYTLRRVDQVGR